MDTEAVTHKPAKSKTRQSRFLSICQAICIGLSICVLGLGIAKFVMGIIYFNDCEIQPLLPVYLIVDVCIWVLFFLVICIFVYGFGQQDSRTDTKRPGTSIFSALVLSTTIIVPAFLFSWFVTGTVWAVKTREDIYSLGHCQNVSSSPNISTTTHSGQSNPQATTIVLVAQHHCVSCNEVLVNFTFGVVIAQWSLFGVALASVVLGLLLFGLVLWIWGSIN